jgi:N-acyl-D-amino-acid deacylase
MRPIAALCVGLALATSARATDSPAAAVRAAIEKGLKRVAQGVSNYPRHRRCFSCHHQAMAVLSLTSARRRGFAVDPELVQKQVDFSLKTFRNKGLIARGRGVGGDSTGVVYALHTFAAAGRPADDTTAALVKYLLVKQRKDGSWPIAPFGDRPPTMGSLFTNAGLALYVLKKYAPPEGEPDAAALRERIAAAFARGRDWLLANKPASTEDRVFHLRGLVDGGAPAQAIEEARAGLLGAQRADGSWEQLARMSGDAYATATALVALRHAGLDTGHGAYQKGVRYLVTTQREDGAWLVRTRSRPLQVFFDNGDPGGKSQFISFAATNWAVLALLETVPPQAGGRKEGRGD